MRYKKKILSFKNTIQARNFDTNIILFYIILILGFLIRVIGINYNTAFNDEAIYVVIGRLGLFANDWWSYGANLWMAGLPYIYPPMTALAYELGGIVGSRLLNVLFGVILVEEVYRFVKLVNLFDTKTNNTAALIAAALVSFSGIGIFVSKLATYDMPSFLFFMIGINSFLKAKNFTNGKYYFLSFLFLFGAFLTKITIAIFFPILLVVAFLMMRQRPVVDRRNAICYLFVPFVLASLVYAGLYWDNLMVYINTHKNLGIAAGYSSLLTLIWEETFVLLLLGIPNLFLLVVARKAKEAAALTVLALAIPLFHLALLRFSTLDKHLYLSVIFLAVIVGYGISLAFSQLASKQKFLLRVGISFVVIIYLASSAQILYIREHDWTNSHEVQRYLAQRVQPGDKVLTEEGGAVILALYDKIFPPKSIVTFDWINYSGLEGEKAYMKALEDKYFDYVELNGRYEGVEELRSNMVEKMGGNYSPIYAKGNYIVYEKNNY